MGTEQNHRNIEKRVSSKPPKCSVCREVVRVDCDWNQGRCPHRPAMVNTTVVKTRLHNLIKFFSGKR